MNIEDLAEVNPKLPRVPSPDANVSFIPMADVTEAGEWTGDQVRRVATVSTGFTPFAEGDVLFAKITPCMENGKGAHARGLTGSIGFGSTEFHVLRARPDVSQRYLFHLCQSREARTVARSFMIGSAGQQRVQTAFFRHHFVPRRSAQERERAAAALDAVDDSVRETERLVAKLHMAHRALLQEVFSLGAGWQETKLSECLLGIDAGSSPSAQDTPAPRNQAGVLKVSAVHPDGFRPDENKVLPSLSVMARRFEVGPGDLLMTRANTSELVGLPCLVGDVRPSLFLCDKTLRLRPNTLRVSPEFLFFALQADDVRRQIFVHATGTSGSMKNISQAGIRALTIGRPGLDAQAQAVARLVASSRRIRTEVATRDKLVLLRHGLATDLLTGRVRTTPEATL